MGRAPQPDTLLLAICETTKKQILRYLIKFTITLAALCLGLYYLHSTVLLEQWPAQAEVGQMIPANYIFLFLLNLGSYALVWTTWRIAPLKTGFAFLGLSLLKLMIAVAYLWRPLQNLPSGEREVVLHFMLPYLLMLILEVREVQSLLKTTQDQSSGPD